MASSYQLPKISPIILDAHKKLLTLDSQITIRSTLLIFTVKTRFPLISFASAEISDPYISIVSINFSTSRRTMSASARAHKEAHHITRICPQDTSCRFTWARAL